MVASSCIRLSMHDSWIAHHAVHRMYACAVDRPIRLVVLLWRRFVGGESSNYDDSGFFSSQVTVGLNSHLRAQIRP